MLDSVFVSISVAKMLHNNDFNEKESIKLLKFEKIDKDINKNTYSTLTIIQNDSCYILTGFSFNGINNRLDTHEIYSSKEKCFNKFNLHLKRINMINRYNKKIIMSKNI